PLCDCRTPFLRVSTPHTCTDLYHDQTHHPGIVSEQIEHLGQLPLHLRDEATVSVFLANGDVKHLRNIPPNVRTREVCLEMIRRKKVSWSSLPSHIRALPDVYNAFVEHIGLDENMVFEIEKVLGKRIRNKKKQYLVKWKDFP